MKKTFDVFEQIVKKPSPAEKGETFIIPRLMVSEDGFLQFASPDNIYAFFYQNIQDYADPKLSESDFNITGNYGDGFSIDINNNRLVNTFLDKSQLLPFMEDTDVFTPVNFINWLDSNLKQNDISQPQMVVWLRKVIDHLTETRKIPLANLVIAKFSLLNVLTARIETAREKAHKKSFELFHKDQERVLLDFDNGYTFQKGMYDFIIPNEGTYQFKKHFLSIVPCFDGGENGEEGECAKLLDANPNIKYWIRNIEKQTASFKLPTPKGYFYPDFAAQLKDGRILIVEYKGNHLVSNDDTKDKRIIGETWEKNSKGKGIFLIATQVPKTKRDANGKTVEQQIAEAIGK